nr:MAG TPA: Major capsid protein [Microviridae sp.]
MPRKRMRRRSTFGLSHYRLFSAKMGYIYPIACYEVLPGDTFRQSTSLFLRLAPLVTPVMHPVHVKIHSWYVPYRLLWEDWEDFRTRGPEGTDASEVPYITAPSGGFPVGSLADYLGIPTGIGGLTVNAFAFRAYNYVVNENYRDERVQNELPWVMTGGADTTTSTVLAPSPWGRDYFTTASPTPQTGPEVTIPINSSMDGLRVEGNGQPVFSVGQPGGTKQWMKLMLKQNYTEADGGKLPNFSAGGAPLYVGAYPNSGEAFKSNLSWQDPALKVVGDSSSGQLGTINIADWREAMAMQRFEETRSLWGARYNEFLMDMGIRPSDARLQLPEYLGGGRQTIQFSEVLQTAPGGEDPVGALKGHGIGAMRTNRFRRFFEEDGIVLTFAMVRPIGVYMQGLHKMWSRRSFAEFYNYQFEHLSQQPVYTRELYAGVTDKDKVFGYQNIYDDYRSIPSQVSGEMRTVLNSWHMARDFSNEPVLNGDFISSPPTNRIFAAQQNDTLYCMAHHTIHSRRLLPRFGDPR